MPSVHREPQTREKRVAFVEGQSNLDQGPNHSWWSKVVSWFTPGREVHLLFAKVLSILQTILRQGIAIASESLKPSRPYRVLFVSLRTLLGKLPHLLCALIATDAAAQVVVAPAAAGLTHLEGSKSSYLQRASVHP